MLYLSPHLAFMKKAPLAFLALSLFTFAACTNSNQPTENYIPLSEALNKTPSGVPGQPASGTGDAAQPLSGEVKLNPAHGQPGHRCDIAEGAPLPIEGTSPQQQQQQATPPPPPQAQPITVAVPPPTQAAPTSTAKGMNPEHGKPGHRCDIAVGAPLDSKPASTPTTVVSTTTPAKVAPGMNPAHGEPGHRCDIAVGAPLNEKKSDVIQVKSETKDSSN